MYNIKEICKVSRKVNINLIMGFTKRRYCAIIEKVFENNLHKERRVYMYYFKEFFENTNEYDYEQLPNIMQDEYTVENLFKFIG